jgi:RecJ-like exonuclease
MQSDTPEPVTAPSPGYELCYECDGKRICIYCRGRGKLTNGKRCSTCYGDGKCIVCNGAGELPEGTEKAVDEASGR